MTNPGLFSPITPFSLSLFSLVTVHPGQGFALTQAERENVANESQDYSVGFLAYGPKGPTLADLNRPVAVWYHLPTVDAKDIDN